MKDQSTPDLEHAAAALSVNSKGHEVQFLPTVIKYKVRKLKDRYFKAEVSEISAKEYYQHTGLKREDRE